MLPVHLCDHALDLDALDPGIRETVGRLRAAGFKTCDSGDGVSKFVAGREADAECAIPEPHVFMMIEPTDLVADATRLLAWTTERVVDPDVVRVEVNYSPNDGAAVLMLFGVHDRDWKPAVAS